MDTTANNTATKTLDLRRPLLLLALTPIIAFVCLLNFGGDWGIFRTATLELISGRTPYTGGVYTPPWGFLPLVPLAILPAEIGADLVALLCLASFAYVGYRMGAGPVQLALLLASPPVLFLAFNGNIDWLVILGYLLPPRIGLFFVLAKPQIGFAVALFWLVEAWREGGPRQVFSTFAPVATAYAVSLAVYGPAMIGAGTDTLIDKGWSWDANLFPLSIPVGLVLLTLAVQRRSKGEAILASPFFMPYVGFYSWPAPLLGLLPNRLAFTAGVVGLWVVHFLAGWPWPF